MVQLPEQLSGVGRWREYMVQLPEHCEWSREVKEVDGPTT